MINPQRGSESVDNSFVVCDIENWPDGSVLHIGTTWRETRNGKVKHRVDDCWEDWWSWIRVIARTDKRFRRIFAHNGGGWDWVSFAEYLLKKRPNAIGTISIARAMSKLIVMTVKVGERFNIQFCDSLYLLRSSLAELSKVFLGEQGKIKLDKLPHEIWQTDRDLYFEYLRKDCESLLFVLEHSLAALRKIAPIKNLGATIGSTAMTVFRTGFLKTPIATPNGKAEKEFLREGYRGGRVEVFQYGHFDNMVVYDINSLYPSAMISSEMPISDRMIDTSVYREKMLGIYELDFQQTRTDLPPLFLVDGDGTYEGRGVYFTPEIQQFLRLGLGKIKFRTGYAFVDSGKPFDDYVAALYKWRLTDRKGPVGLLCKYLLNSLYGKFGQKSVRESLEIYDNSEDQIAAWKKHREKGKKINPVSDDLSIVAIEESCDVAFEHVGIAGMITSQARSMLYTYVMEAGAKNVTYVDTDSIHCIGPCLDKFVSESLGSLKIEANGQGVYAGKKLYSIRESNGATKVRAKGVSIGGRNGCSFNFDDMVRVSQGAAVICEFSCPASILDVLKGKDTSCRIGSKTGGHNRKRTLRRT